MRHPGPKSSRISNTPPPTGFTSQVAEAGLAQAHQQPPVRHTVLQAVQPGVERVGALDREQAGIVFERLQLHWQQP
jgi:hypothetical protein